MDEDWVYDLLESAASVPDPDMMRLVIDDLLTGVINRDVQLPGSDSLLAMFRPIHAAAVSGHIQHVSMLLEFLIKHDGAHSVVIPSLKAAMMVQPTSFRCLAVAAVMISELVRLSKDTLIEYYLIAAVRSGNLAMVELHLNAGANVRHNGNEALRLAESQGHAAMVELLKARCAGSD